MKSYKSFSAGGVVSFTTKNQYEIGDRIYVVPNGCAQAKITFLSDSNHDTGNVSASFNATIAIKKYGSDQIVSLPVVSIMARCFNGATVDLYCVDLSNAGIYLNAGDELYCSFIGPKGLTNTLTFSAHIFVSGLLEYEV